MNSSDKRKHFRFPAYDDETGVKLNRRSKQRQSPTRPRMTTSAASGMENVVLDPVEMVGEPKFFRQDGAAELDIQRTNTNRPIQQHIEVEKAQQLPEQPVRENRQQRYQEPIEQPVRDDRYQRYQEPTRQPIRQRVQQSITAKPNRQQMTQQTSTEDRQVNLNKEEVSIKKMDNHIYAEPTQQEYKAPQSSFSNKFYEADQNGQAKYRKKYSGKKPFKSSYNLPGEETKEMFQPKYIPASLIEDEPQKRPQLEASQLVNELRKTSENSMFVVDSLPENVDKVSEEVPEEKQPRKNQRLEKSLSGIIEDESGQRLDTYYFD